MEKNKKILILFVGVVLLCFTYYFFIDTLTMSDIVGRSNSPRTNIFINLFDFDTGLTRYDIYQLGKKSEYWNKRITEVNSIKNFKKKQIENEKLMAEMMLDPTMKKVTKRFVGFGSDVMLNILKAIN